MDKYSWDIFDNWNYREKKVKIIPHWSLFDKITSSLKSYYQIKYEDFNILSNVWNERLEMYGGNTSKYNWNNFRPLRLEREEDWSDWLAYLISESRTDSFSSYLFKLPNFHKRDYSNPKNVLREVSYKGYRADIIIEWRNKYYTHIELKIGDANLAKTYKTAALMREYFRISRSKWHNFIIILEEQEDSWLGLFNNTDELVSNLLWSDVAIAIRKSLLYSDESIAWKVWAYSFLGAIEQKLLNFKIDYKISDLLQIDKNIMIFKEGMSDG